MNGHRSFVMVSGITIIGLLLSSCGPAAPLDATPARKAVESAPPVPTPTSKPEDKASSRYGGTLNISTIGDPPSFDMHQETPHMVENLVQCAYNGVTQFDPNNPEAVIGDLAESWKVDPDGLTYTFHSHRNVKFHDGSSLTSEDVQFSFDRQMNPPKGVLAPRRADLAAISKVEAPDKDTVRFILKYPSSSFLNVISSGWMVIYSKSYVENKGDMKKEVMGTGPYKFKAYSSGSSVEYVKNQDYFVKGRPYLDGINFYIIRDPATRLAAFRTGRIKLTGPGESGLAPADAETLTKTMPQAVIMPHPSLSRMNLGFNTKQEPWTDIRVRRAADMAIDRQQAIRVLASGYGEIGSFMSGKWGIPKEELLKMPGYRQPKDDEIAEAKRLLAEAGYPNGFTAKILVVNQKRYQDLCVFLADQLSRIGIKLELDVKEITIRRNLLDQGNFSLHGTPQSLAFSDPENVRRYFAPPQGENWGQNWQRVTDEKVWELFEKQSRALDPQERLKIVRELDLRLVETSVQPVVFWSNDLIGMWPEVRDRGKVIGMYSFQKYQDIWRAK